MANINKIRLSGQTYNIQDENATKTLELTQAQYDALVSGGTVDPNTFYIITDATSGDLSNYYTKSETSGATEISTALNAKQDTLVSGTNIKTINNESILGSGNIDIQGGGGKAIEAGTNISVTTGETADTINCTLPITTAIDNTSLNFGFNTINSEVSYSFGNANTVGRSRYNGSYSMAVGLANIADGGEAEFVTGYNNRLLNVHEFGSGQFNNSVLASTTFGDSGNTLFSVGNGTADDARHNAFEIRQNGDIYLSSGGTDIKLQDHLGGGGGVNVVQTTGTSTTDVMSQNAVTTEISTALASKQDTLVSGTNIKTINNQSLLGEGNITIEGGGGGITSGEVQTMIDESISGKTNQNDNLFTIRTNVIEAVVISGGAKLRIIFAFDIIQNNQIVLSTDTVNDKSSLLSALAALGFDNKIYDIRDINYTEDTSLTSYFGEYLGHKCYAVLLNYVPNFGSITIGLKRNNVYYTLNAVSNGKYDYNYLSNKPSVTSAITSGSTDIVTSGGVYDQLGGLKLVKLSQSEYDSLATKDNSTLYVIVN